MKLYKEKKGLSLITAILIIAAIFLVIIVVKMLTSDSEKKDNNITQNTSEMQTRTETQNTDNEQKQAPIKTPSTEFVEQLDDGTKVNTSQKVKETKNIRDYEVTDIKLTTTNGISTMIATVKNTGSSKLPETEVTIQILDKEGNIITDFLGVINELEAGATTTLNASVTADVSNAYDFKLIER